MEICGVERDAKLLGTRYTILSILCEPIIQKEIPLQKTSVL